MIKIKRYRELEIERYDPVIYRFREGDGSSYCEVCGGGILAGRHYVSLTGKHHCVMCHRPGRDFHLEGDSEVVEVEIGGERRAVRVLAWDPETGEALAEIEGGRRGYFERVSPDSLRGANEELDKAIAEESRKLEEYKRTHAAALPEEEGDH
jgi:hypothetical protein